MGKFGVGSKKIDYFIYQGHDILNKSDNDSAIGSKVGTVIVKGKAKQAIIFFKAKEPTKPDFSHIPNNKSVSYMGNKTYEKKLKEYEENTNSAKSHLRLFLEGRNMPEENIEKILNNINKITSGPKEIKKFDDGTIMYFQRPIALNIIDTQNFEDVASKLRLNMRESPESSPTTFIKSNSWMNKETNKIKKSQNLLMKMVNKVKEKTIKKEIKSPEVFHKKGDTLEMAKRREKMILSMQFREIDYDFASEHDSDTGLNASFSEKDDGTHKNNLSNKTKISDDYSEINKN